LQIFKVFNLY